MGCLLDKNSYLEDLKNILVASKLNAHSQTEDQAKAIEDQAKT